jgi:hypothetical protein
MNEVVVPVDMEYGTGNARIEHLVDRPGVVNISGLIDIDDPVAKLDNHIGLKFKVHDIDETIEQTGKLLVGGVLPDALAPILFR